MQTRGAEVLADELLDEAFTNILSNSVRYTDGNEVPIEVEFEEEMMIADMRIAGPAELTRVRGSGRSPLQTTGEGFTMT
jgi:signal transduction histidine kinase